MVKAAKKIGHSSFLISSPPHFPSATNPPFLKPPLPPLWPGPLNHFDQISPAEAENEKFSRQIFKFCRGFWLKGVKFKFLFSTELFLLFYSGFFQSREKDGWEEWALWEKEKEREREGRKSELILCSLVWHWSLCPQGAQNLWFLSVSQTLSHTLALSHIHSHTHAHTHTLSFTVPLIFFFNPAEAAASTPSWYPSFLPSSKYNGPPPSWRLFSKKIGPEIFSSGSEQRRTDLARNDQPLAPAT